MCILHVVGHIGGKAITNSEVNYQRKAVYEQRPLRRCRRRMLCKRLGDLDVPRNKDKASWFYRTVIKSVSG